MTAIAATRRTVRELVDGTLCVLIHVAPPDKAEFLRLLPDVDTPCFIARDVRHEPIAKAPDWHKDFADAPKPLPTGYQNIAGSDDKPKGGPHSQDAARICKSAEFIEFVSYAIAVPVAEMDQDEAAQYVRARCGIDSRAELDHKLHALTRFHELMREFNEWRERAA